MDDPYLTSRGPPLSPLHESACLIPAQSCLSGLTKIPEWPRRRDDDGTGALKRFTQLDCVLMSTFWRVSVLDSVTLPFAFP